jgi:hypothetical protein
MTALQNWLDRATRQLSPQSAARVRSEILDHFENAREAALASGADALAAEQAALAALGEAEAANAAYRQVMLTAAEERILRQGNCEFTAVGSRRWLRIGLFCLPGLAMLGAAIFSYQGHPTMARKLIVGAFGMLLVLGVPFLPIYTPMRAKVYRYVKTAAFAAVFGWVLTQASASTFAVLVAITFPLWMNEATRCSIRRKLPVAEWPKQLYL